LELESFLGDERLLIANEAEADCEIECGNRARIGRSLYLLKRV
jgi:hypothetical protein